MAMTGAVVSIAQQKGGAGKTTLAIQLGVAWLVAGKRVAMLDIDPQASLFTWFNLRRRRLGDDEGGLVVQGLSGWRLGSELNFYFDLDKSQIELRARSDDENGNVVPEEHVDVERELERVADEIFDTAENDDERVLIQEARTRVVNLYRNKNE